MLSILSQRINVTSVMYEGFNQLKSIPTSPVAEKIADISLTNQTVVNPYLLHKIMPLVDILFCLQKVPRERE